MRSLPYEAMRLDVLPAARLVGEITPAQDGYGHAQPSGANHEISSFEFCGLAAFPHCMSTVMIRNACQPRVTHSGCRDVNVGPCLTY